MLVYLFSSITFLENGDNPSSKSNFNLDTFYFLSNILYILTKVSKLINAVRKHD